MENSIVESRQEELMTSLTALVNEKPVSRTAHFLKPCLSLNHQGISQLSSLSLLSLPPSFDPKNWPLTVKFNGWWNPIKYWKEWVYKMASLHSPIWRQAGIYDAILLSSYQIHTHTDFILGFSERWLPQTNSFVFPWGEATITLEDMFIAGYSVLGSPVFEPLKTEESKAVLEELVQERLKLIRTPSKKPYHCAWLNAFMDSGSKIEHEAFLSLWLSRFVLPTSIAVVSECVFPIAIHLAKGTRIALAPAVLATIYRDLSLLKQKISSLTTLDADAHEKLVATTYAPFQLVLVWVWERFLKLSPKPKLLEIGEPRFARWNNAKCNVKNVRSLLDASKVSFNWRPYTKPLHNWDFPKFYREQEMWVFSDSDLDDDLLSFILCLRVSNLVGMDLKCREQYLPHRVARQFGFDQDVPGIVDQSSRSYKDAWSRYIRLVGDVKCFIPSRMSEKDVTLRYLDWLNSLEFPQRSNLVTNASNENQKATASLNRTMEDDKGADGDCTILKSSKSPPRGLEKMIEETNNLPAPPGFSPKCDRVDVSDSSDEEDNLTISQFLKSMRQCGNSKKSYMENQDEISNRQCDNLNDLTGTPKSNSVQIATKTSVVAATAKSTDDCNLIPSQWQTHSCSGAVNGILTGSDNGEDADPENARVQLGECQSRVSSVAGNDQTVNESEVKEARMTENSKVNEKQDVESTSLAADGKNSINGYSCEAIIMGMEHRIGRLEKINAVRKALSCRRYSGKKPRRA